MSLPKFTMTLREMDPTWVPKFSKGSNTATNHADLYKMYEIEVEVVQLNLNTGGMRIRYEWPSKHTKKGFEVQSRDVSIEEFYKRYSIVENKQ